VSEELGITRRPVSDQEVLERCLYVMINEGAKILEEKIALRASDIDTVWINGYGFPPHRGGPMYHADQIGLRNILGRIRELQRTHGEMWRPAALLERLAAEGRGFASLDQ
jgi:3-hydroxyacyl-CoA dehydrogenase